MVNLDPGHRPIVYDPGMLDEKNIDQSQYNQFHTHKQLKLLSSRLFEQEKTPLTLYFLARQSLRKKILDTGCFDIEYNPIVDELPNQIKQFIFFGFDEIDSKKMCQLYQESDCGCKCLTASGLTGAICNGDNS